MHHIKRWNIFLLLVCVVSIGAWRVLPVASSHPAQAKMQRHTATTTSIKHVVIIMMENHTFDNFFGRFPGANGRGDLPRASNPPRGDLVSSLGRRAGERGLQTGAWRRVATGCRARIEPHAG